MTCKTSYELHHNFPKLAHEAGFTFNAHRPKVKMDWNKLKTIDIHSVIKERQFYIIEQHINDILDCVLESEFDMRILDEGVVKMFRIAQLAVEYHEFCRHYLDRSVYVLRGEIASLMQELSNSKKQIQEKDYELKKIKKRSRNSIKATGPYHNDNIAALIMRTLTNKGDVFQSTVTEPMSHYRCLHCDKVFVNNIYLQSHMTRRHPQLAEAPQKDSGPEIHSDNENHKLVDEIRDLKSKLKQMGDVLIQNTKINDLKVNSAVEDTHSTNLLDLEQSKTKEMKDAVVSPPPFDESVFLEKLELWKTIEQQRHDQEVNYLKNQILETINSLKDIETINHNDEEDKKVINTLKETIKLQNEEIDNLRRELTDKVHKQQTDTYETDGRKKLEEQMAYWVSKAETQSQQYDLLVEKLNEVAKNANDSRAIADLERERAAHLQSLLEQSLHGNHHKDCNISKVSNSENKAHVQTNTDDKYIHQSRTSLGELQQKAQTLLEISSSSSELETIAKTLITSKPVKPKPKVGSGKLGAKNQKGALTPMKILNKTTPKKTPVPRISHTQGKKSKTEKPYVRPSRITEHGQVYTIYPVLTTPASPSKVVRAKITEEVNNRLATMGVDPLKNRVPHVLFNRQRIQIQHLSDKKIKANPYREKLRYAILEHLNIKTTELTKKESLAPEYTSPSSTSAKPFNLYTVLSNVKTKALSLVKSHDSISRDTSHKNLNADVTKRTLMFLKTPPDSPANSPVNRKKKHFSHSETALRDKAKTFLNSSKNNGHSSSSSSSSENSEESNSKDYSQQKAKTTKSSKRENLQIHSGSDSDAEIVTTKSPVTNKINSLETLIQSPARRPSSASTLRQKNSLRDTTSKRSQSVMSLLSDEKLVEKNKTIKSNQEISTDTESEESPLKKDATRKLKTTERVTKSVLKNASSTSSLNKKKVLFDMDAIQMKSVSASPDTTPGIDPPQNNDDSKMALGLIHVDGEEWDISSIESEDQLRNLTQKSQILNASDKSIVKELKQAIESQLARRQNSTPTAPVGGVDVLQGPQLVKSGLVSGSNTSLGSSILDESEANQKVLFRPRRLTEKEDSELEISEISMDGRGSKNDF